MYFQELKLIGSEWKLFALLVISILTLSIISLFINIDLVNIALFLLGLDICYGYLIILGKKLRNEPIEKKYQEIFSGKYKKRSNLLLLFLFFGAIIILLKAPFYLFTFIAAEKIDKLLSSSTTFVTILNVLATLFIAIYKTALYGAIANLAYYYNEVLKSFQAGIKNLIHFKGIILILFIYDLIVSPSILNQKPAVIVMIQLTQYIIAILLTAIILANYALVDQKNQESKVEE